VAKSVYNVLNLIKRPEQQVKIQEETVYIKRFTDVITKWLIIPNSDFKELLKSVLMYILSSLFLLLPMAVIFVASLMTCIVWVVHFFSPKTDIVTDNDVCCYKCRTPNNKKWVIFCHICYGILALFMMCDILFLQYIFLLVSAGCMIGILGVVHLNVGMGETIINATGTIDFFYSAIEELKSIEIGFFFLSFLFIYLFIFLQLEFLFLILPREQRNI
jgi:hypothetical protein